MDKNPMTLDELPPIEKFSLRPVVGEEGDMRASFDFSAAQFRVNRSNAKEAADLLSKEMMDHGLPEASLDKGYDHPGNIRINVDFTKEQLPAILNVVEALYSRCNNKSVTAHAARG